jgi:hypothetical protein
VLQPSWNRCDTRSGKDDALAFRGHGHAFGQQLEAHISRIRRLSLSGQIPTVLERIISSSPDLPWSLSPSYRRDGDDVLRIIPHIARNARGPAPLRSMAISANRSCALICAWTIPDADVMIVDSGSMFYGDESSARVVLFGATTRGDDRWRYGTDSEIADALLTHLPINEISTLSTWDDTRLSKEFWFRHAPRLAMLNRAYLVSTAIKAFREVISIVAPGERPGLPRLTKLILGNVTLTTLMTCNLLCMLMKRMEQGAPLQSLDLRTCYAADLCIQVLAKAVGELQVPVELLTIGDPATFSDTDNVTDVHYDSFEGEGDESDYTDI